MADYRLHVNIIKRKNGQSAVAAAAYRAGERLVDERTGEVKDYSNRHDILYTEIMTPDHAPDWTRDRAALWNAVERREDQHNRHATAQLAREIQLNLPHELENWQRTELVRDFVRQEFVNRGMVADIALHAPDPKGDGRNYHAHVMLTMREVSAEGFGGKGRDWNSPELLQHWRERWADFQNRSLEQAGHSERVDHRSYDAQGIDKEPTQHMGPTATDMERRGEATDIGDKNRDIQARNEERARLKEEAKVIDLALEREKRQAAKDRLSASQQWAAAQEAKARPAPATDIPRQKGKFEEWANRRRAEEQTRRHDESGELGERHSRESLQLEKQLAATYGPGIQEADATLADVRRRQQQTGLKSFLYHITRQAHRDRLAAQAAELTLADSHTRMNEQRGQLARHQQAETQYLDNEHARRSEALEERIQNAYERREREGWRDPWGGEQQREEERASQEPQTAQEKQSDGLSEEWARTAESSKDNAREQRRTGTNDREADPGRGRERGRGRGFD